MVDGSPWKWGEIYPFLVEDRLKSWNVFVSPTSKKSKSLIGKELSEFNRNINYLPYCEDAFSPNDEIIDVFNKALDDFISNKSKRKTKFKLPGFGFGK